MVCSFFPSPSVGPEDVEALALILSGRVAQVEELDDDRRAVATCFDSPRPPQISLHDYAMRLLKRFKCSPECFLLSFVYIDRLAATGVSLRATNAHRLLLTTVVVAAKVFDDTSFTNSSYAKVGGVNGEQLNEMESCLLRRLAWHVHVTREAYDSCLSLVAVDTRAPESLIDVAADPSEVHVAPVAEVCTVASPAPVPPPVADRLPVGCPPLGRASRPRAAPRPRCRGQRKAEERRPRCPPQGHTLSTSEVH